jgi:hypothetical protein
MGLQVYAIDCPRRCLSSIRRTSGRFTGPGACSESERWFGPVGDCSVERRKSGTDGAGTEQLHLGGEGHRLELVGALACEPIDTFVPVRVEVRTELGQLFVELGEIVVVTLQCTHRQTRRWLRLDL